MPRELCWVKNANVTKMSSTVWFHVYSILEMTKLQTQRTDQWLLDFKERVMSCTLYQSQYSCCTVEWFCTRCYHWQAWVKCAWGSPIFTSFLKNWTTVGLQCCVSFRCTAKWFSYTYIYILFQFYFLCKILNIVQYIVGPCDYLFYL